MMRERAREMAYHQADRRHGSDSPCYNMTKNVLLLRGMLYACVRTYTTHQKKEEGVLELAGGPS